MIIDGDPYLRNYTAKQDRPGFYVFKEVDDGWIMLGRERVMSDLISRKALIEAFKEEFFGMYSDDFKYMINWLEELPTAEKKGEWVKEWRNAPNGYTHISGYKCSECGALYPWGTNYCPNCGCRMTEN